MEHQGSGTAMSDTPSFGQQSTKRVGSSTTVDEPARRNKTSNLDSRRVSGQATLAGATLGGVTGVAVGSGTGMVIATHLGLCALGGMASCGLLLPIIGATIGGITAREWIETRIARITPRKPKGRSGAVASPGKLR